MNLRETEKIYLTLKKENCLRLGNYLCLGKTTVLDFEKQNFEKTQNENL